MLNEDSEEFIFSDEDNKKSLLLILEDNKSLVVGFFVCLVFLFVLFVLPAVNLQEQIILAGGLIMALGLILVFRSFYNQKIFFVGSATNLFVAFSREENRLKLLLLKIVQGLSGLFLILLGSGMIIFSGVVLI